MRLRLITLSMYARLNREDGALHAEKYYRTVAEDFHSTRAAFPRPRDLFRA
jgi:hypothetical protein